VSTVMADMQLWDMVPWFAHLLVENMCYRYLAGDQRELGLTILWELILNCSTSQLW
jgi:hypothetical protein